jgi:hypothetical protein
MNKLFLFGIMAVASMLVFATSEIGLGLIQQADAVRCDRSVVAVCGVCVNANVIGQQVSQRCEG